MRAFNSLINRGPCVQGLSDQGRTAPRLALLPALVFGLFVGTGSAMAATTVSFDVSQVPLYLGGTIEPNVMYIHDDSGSMYWSFMPDGTFGANNQRRARWSGYN